VVPKRTRATDELAEQRAADAAALPRVNDAQREFAGRPQSGADQSAASDDFSASFAAGKRDDDCAAPVAGLARENPDSIPAEHRGRRVKAAVARVSRQLAEILARVPEIGRYQRTQVHTRAVSQKRMPARAVEPAEPLRIRRHGSRPRGDRVARTDRSGSAPDQVTANPDDFTVPPPGGSLTAARAGHGTRWQKGPDVGGKRGHLSYRMVSVESGIVRAAGGRE
jgi:hypothetical protein